MGIRQVVVVVAAFALTGCASIISKSDWPVQFTSPTPGTDFTVRNDSGMLIAQGKAPTVLMLTSREGFFSGADYTVEGGGMTTTLNSRLNGWYFGNVIFGGLLGLLIIDPATGAMWRLPEYAYVGQPEPKPVILRSDD